MAFFKEHYIKLIFIFLIILSGCKLQDPKKTHGIVFLENRSNKLIINKSNKNDVIKIIGFPQIVDELDNNNWIYVERILSTGKFYKLGSNELRENNVLVLNFDKYGILNFKKIYTKKEMEKIKFSKKNTENNLSKRSFVQTFLQSVKEKMYSNRQGKKF